MVPGSGSLKPGTAEVVHLSDTDNSDTDRNAAMNGRLRPAWNGRSPWEEQEKFADRHSVKVGSARVIRTRAIFHEWSLAITAEHDPEVANLFNTRLWAEIAGARIGLGDYRPQRGGLFGRFEVKVTDSP